MKSEKICLINIKNKDEKCLINIKNKDEKCLINIKNKDEKCLINIKNKDEKDRSIWMLTIKRISADYACTDSRELA